MKKIKALACLCFAAVLLLTACSYSGGEATGEIGGEDTGSSSNDTSEQVKQDLSQLDTSDYSGAFGTYTTLSDPTTGVPVMDAVLPYGWTAQVQCDWGFVSTSNPCIAVAAETANDNMFQLTPSGSAEGCIANDNAFRVCFSDPEQGTLSADYIVENSLAAKVAVIYDSSDPYSSGIHDAFVTEAQEKGLEIVSDEAFTADSNKDFTVQIQKAQSAGAELVFLPIYYTEASLILTQADKIGYEPVFFGCDGLDGLVSVENFDTSLAEDVMLMTPFTASATDDKTAAFVKAYNEAYGEDPNQFAADAYDAIYAIHAAVEKAGVTADMDASAICDALKAAFTEITLEGLTGKGITWDASGAPAKSPLVYIIKDGVYTAA